MLGGEGLGFLSGLRFYFSTLISKESSFALEADQAVVWIVARVGVTWLTQASDGIDPALLEGLI